MVEVANVSPHGFWLLLGDRELFLSFADFPWFRDASIAELCDVDVLGRDHLCWPALDVDLSVESILHPERFPLVSRIRVKKRIRRRRTRSATMQRVRR